VVAAVLTYGIPDARRAVLRGGGHVVNWAEPERFAAEVLRFLREVDEGS
jgi:pimeloyl-ACP methyl ester carboxylesterase